MMSPSRYRRLLYALVIALTTILWLAEACLAKKGGGKPGGGDDPPPPVLPTSYSITAPVITAVAGAIVWGRRRATGSRASSRSRFGLANRCSASQKP